MTVYTSKLQKQLCVIVTERKKKTLKMLKFEPGSLFLYCLILVKVIALIVEAIPLSDTKLII